MIFSEVQKYTLTSQNYNYGSTTDVDKLFVWRATYTMLECALTVKHLICNIAAIIPPYQQMMTIDGSAY